jgi:hypothetical protein
VKNRRGWDLHPDRAGEQVVEHICWQVAQV